MTTHETIARQLAADPETVPVLAHASARQGDLILLRIGHHAPSDLVFSAVLLAAGSHGEHWAIGPCAMDGDSLAVAHGTIVVHTDVPSARHRAVALEPGTWQYSRQRELGLDQVVRQVQD
mgnify:CR=1 FL=1